MIGKWLKMLKIDDKDYTWFLFALTLIFASAKSFGLSNISWMFVFSPLWIVGGVWLILYGIVVSAGITITIGYLIFLAIKKVFKREND